MTENHKDFDFTHAGYRMAGFTVPQEGMRSGFDRQREDELVESCAQVIAEVFGNPNKFERRLARQEGIPIEDPATRRLYMNVIYADDPHYYCAGSGGIGGGKVFWTPHTSEDKDTAKKVREDDLCDNCRTLSHESQHGIGAKAEFDFFSELAMLHNRFKNFPKEERPTRRLASAFISSEAACKPDGIRERWRRKNRNLLCAIHERHPEAVEEALVEEGFTPEIVSQVLGCACSGKTVV